jgi:hypothetical protein
MFDSESGSRGEKSGFRIQDKLHDLQHWTQHCFKHKTITNNGKNRIFHLCVAKYRYKTYRITLIKYASLSWVVFV